MQVAFFLRHLTTGSSRRRPLSGCCQSILWLIIMLGMTASAGAININVPGDKPTIKQAIVIAEDGDTILVASGTYTGVENRDLELGRKAIVLRSIKGPTATVIDCQGTPQNPHRAFYIHQGEDSRTVVSGFTIMNGYASPASPDGMPVGGGILCDNASSPQILNCVFYKNVADGAGGGLAVLNGSSPYIAGCAFIDNTAIDTARVGVGYGGGVRCLNSSPFFTGCIFSSNRANVGGGLSCNQADIVLDACEFNNNTADVYITFEPVTAGVGGGAHFFQSSPIISGCVFDHNTAVYGNNMDMQNTRGGGVAAIESALSMENCTLYGNVAEKYGDQVPGQGAGLYFSESEGTIQSCIAAFNSGGEAIFCTGCTVPITVPTLLCSDIYGNELGDWTDDIADQLGFNGNFTADPLFCDTVISDFYLSENSPCAPASSPCAGFIGAFNVGCVTDVDNQTASNDHIAQFSLFPNYPNPFNQATIIPYSLARSANATLVIYNILGQSIRTLASGDHAPGMHRATWDGTDRHGTPVASGLYIYMLRVDNARRTGSMILMK